jgi:hypothetical protein
MTVFSDSLQLALLLAAVCRTPFHIVGFELVNQLRHDYFQSNASFVNH